MKTEDLKDMYGNKADEAAQYFDTFWKQFLKVFQGELYVKEQNHWARSQHKGGISMIKNGECLCLKTGELCKDKK